MSYEEYVEKRKELRTEYFRKEEELDVEYSTSTQLYNVGDDVGDDSGMIRVDDVYHKISSMSGLNVVQPHYAGIRLTLSGTPRKDWDARVIPQNRITKHFKKPQ